LLGLQFTPVPPNRKFDQGFRSGKLMPVLDGDDDEVPVVHAGKIRVKPPIHPNAAKMRSLSPNWGMHRTWVVVQT
jgi:hypothetical protein